MSSTASKSSRAEDLIIVLLCVIAGVRVFVFSAAFPFFSNIDEDLHFDLIAQYSAARIPRNFDRLNQQTLNWIVPYASPEFLFAPEHFPERKFPAPLWKEPWSKIEPEIAATRASWSGEINFESSQPPLYYGIAGVWWWVGKHMGLRGIESLYWIRFLNVAVIALVVWLAHVVAKTIAPGRLELQIGVPLLVAFIPQNVFYAMNNDVLSPLCFGVLFLCVLQWLRTDTPGLLLAIITGVAIACTYLTKVSNLPLILVATAVVLVRLVAVIPRIPHRRLTTFLAFAMCAALPIGIWIVWLKLHFGDFTGSAAKMAFLDWTRKPFSDWWQHPIFTPAGIWTFWSDLMARFWRGEVEWHGRPFNWHPADEVFVVSSLAFILAAVLGLRKQFGLSTFQWQAIVVAILSVAAAIAFLALLSIQFDFGTCVNPSRSHPYFTSGRLLSGAIIPFALTYVYGMSCLVRFVSLKLGQRNTMRPLLTLVLVGAIAVFSQVEEIVILQRVFASQHNWFHR